MAEGARRERWHHTAALLAWIGNNNPYRKKRKVFVPSDFHPCLKGGKSAALPKAEFGILRSVFVERKRR